MTIPSGASLGQLAGHHGLLPDDERKRLTDELQRAVRAGKPTSLVRLLLKAGWQRDTLHSLLASGAALDTVRCDACGDATRQAQLEQRIEYPCARCGSLLLGFEVFGRTEPPQDEARAGTDRYPQVIPLPNERAPGAPRVPTARYEEVLPVPQDRNDATSPFGHVIALPAPPRPPGRVLSDEEASSELETLLSAPSYDPEGMTLGPGELLGDLRDVETVPPPPQSPAPKGPAPSPPPAPGPRITRSAPIALLPLVIVLAVLLVGIAVGLAMLFLRGRGG